MTKITVIKSINPNRVCKEYTKGDDGKIIKKVVANVTQGIAFTMAADTADEMVTILEQVTSRSDLVICSGQWMNDPGVQFEVLPEKELAQLMGSTIGAVDGGVLEKDGRYVSARVKRGITPSNWVLLDADNPPGIPAEWAAMSIAERLILWEPLLPGISKCERIELRGSSARVVNGSGSQKATHAWIQVSDAQKIALMKAHVGIEMVVQGVSFPFKKVSQTDPNKVVGIESRSVFDLAVFDTGRLVFTAAPQVNIPEYSVDDPGITIINPGCGSLDIDWITPPTKSMQKYRELTGITMNIQLSNEGYVSVHNNGQLTYETEIAVKGVIKPLAAWLETLEVGEKLRCESPFRESQSEAAFIKLGDDGQPFIYDVGNGTTYHLKPPFAVIDANSEVDTSWMKTNKNGELLAKYESLEAVVTAMPIAYDSFLESPMILGDGAWRRFHDGDYVKIAVKLEQMGFVTPPMGTVKEITRSVFKDKQIDTAIEWANSLVWDGTPRVDDLFSRYFGVDQNDYVSSVSTYFATAMAGRLLTPGVKADMVPVLVGDQGLGKTTSVKALAPLGESYSEVDLGSTRDTDIARQLRGKLICELGELKGLKTRDSEWIKSWITRTHEEWTPKYVEYTTVMARRCVFIGTTNEEQFLVDGTGNRRWLPLEVSRPCDAKQIEIDRDQIWAEAIHIYKLIGVAWSVAQELAHKVHKNHMVVDEVMVKKVEDFLQIGLNYQQPFLRMADVCDWIFVGQSVARKDQLRVADAMRHLGYEKKSIRVKEKIFKGWVKNES